MLNITVPPSYPPGYKIVFIGEAGGKEEEEQHEGWVGSAGKCLQKAAGIAQLDWTTCARSNVAKRRPPENDFEKCFYETIEEPIYTKTGKLSKRTKKIERKTQELLEWESSLYAELAERKPNLAVACGNEALETLTGLSGITNYRGSVLAARPEKGIDSLKVLAVEHPSYIIRGQLLDFWILAHDLKKAKREMEFPEIRREPYSVISDAEHNIDRTVYLIDEIGRHPQEKWTLDVETRAGTLACFAIGWNGQPNTFCVPIQLASGPYWSPEDELKIWRALRETAKTNPFLCNQNVEYDICYLLRYGVEPSGIYMDTMLAHSILYPEFPKGLDFLCSFYLDDVIYYKSEGRTWGAKDPDDQLWQYCCKDAIYTRRIVDKIDQELIRRRLYEFYHGFKETV